MKKAKKVKIDKEWWKYFVDHGALDEKDEKTFSRIILYTPDDKRYHYNLTEKRPVGTAEVKKLWKERKFI